MPFSPMQNIVQNGTVNGNAYISASGKKQARGQVAELIWFELRFPSLRVLTSVLRFCFFWNSQSSSPELVNSLCSVGITQSSTRFLNCKANLGGQVVHKFDGIGILALWARVSDVREEEQAFSLPSLKVSSGRLTSEVEQGCSSGSLPGLGACSCSRWAKASSVFPEVEQGCSLLGSTSGSLCLWEGNRIRIMLPSH